MKNILFVGEHPFGTSGNSNMMRSILMQVDPKKYRYSVFVGGNKQHDYVSRLFNPLRFSIIEDNITGDPWGKQLLVDIANQSPDLDAIFFIGVDLWRYADVLGVLKSGQSSRKFQTGFLFPYDVLHVSDDMVVPANLVDVPLVYSEYGFEALKDHVQKVQYFRPPMHYHDIMKPYAMDERSKSRHKLFPNRKDSDFIFGFVGTNIYRKDPQNIMKAFSIAKESNPNIFLHLHTNLTGGVFNLSEAGRKYGLKTGDVTAKDIGSLLSYTDMPGLYNSFDCYINCSLQEGLSWTVIESMLCGTPTIISDNTSHTELISDGNAIGIKPKIPCYIPVDNIKGTFQLDAEKVHPYDLAEAMLKISNDFGLIKSISDKGVEFAKNWISGCHNINLVLDKMLDETSIIKRSAPKKKIKAILFMQHSAAGDVLMTTQCFKGIKQKHPDMPLIYMTSKPFIGIVEKNPYLDRIIEWDATKRNEYEVVYNPHGDKILPGGWNNLDYKLADMYPYFCKVDADAMYITKTKPDLDLPDHYIVVHSTGGQAEYRTYKHLDKVVKKFPDENFVQIGSYSDLKVKGAMDLTGILSWEESAYVMAHAKAKAAVVIDSFPSHLAGAVGTPVVVLYGPAPARVVGPIGRMGYNKIINIEPNKLDVCPILSNCWGDLPNRQKCKSPCINTINPNVIIGALKRLLE